MKKFVTSIIVAALTTGCFGASVTTGLRPNGVVESDTGVSWLWGITTTNTKATECKDGLAKVETYWPWWGALLVVPLTGGFITPVTKEYHCADASK